MDFDTDFGKRTEKLLAWSRYVAWADLASLNHTLRLQRHAIDETTLDQESLRGDTWPLTALMSYWYGSVYVVVEGYVELQYADPEVDNLLKSHRKDSLRRYRNGVFHFQPKFIDKRFTELLTDEEHVAWVHKLHRALRRFCDVELASVTGEADELTAFHSAVAEIFSGANVQPKLS